MFKKLFLIVNDCNRQMKIKNISSYAASTAFFFFLSIVPMVILLCTILPFTPLTEVNLIQFVEENTNAAVKPMLVSIINDVYASGGVLPIAAVFTLWSAAQGMLALTRGLNKVNDVEEKRNYFALRGMACVYTVIFLAVIIVSLLLNVFGNFLLQVLYTWAPKAKTVTGLLENFRFVAVLALLTLFFTVIYTFVPNKKIQFLMQLPGSLLAAVAWSLFSFAFSLYVERFNAFSTYGSLSVIIIIMLWLYFNMYILLIGAHINRYFKPAIKVFVGKRKAKREKNKKRGIKSESESGKPT